MPPQHRFATPAPITLVAKLHRGSVHVRATDTADTTVTVVTSAPDGALGVELSDDGRHLAVVARGRHFRRYRIDVTVELPVGSVLHIDTASADVNVEGTVASAEITSASGRIQIDEVDGRTKLQSASGAIHAGSVRGRLDLHSASGSLGVDTVAGSCNARTASGRIEVGRAESDVTAASASGSVSVREVHHGNVAVTSSSGSVEIGVRRGTLVWLDVASARGRVRSDLDPGEPGGGERPDLALRARTASGSVSITQSGAAPVAS